MSLTSIIRQECPSCKKIAVESSRMKLGKTLIIKLACGHILHSETLQSDESTYESIVFSDGCKPRSYQLEAVKFAEESNIRCIIADEQGLGKFQDVDSLVITPSGSKRIGDIQVGDEIINSSGYTSHVIGVYPQGVKPIYEVVFSDGSKCNSGLEHLWAVNTPVRAYRNNPYKIKSLQTIIDEGLIVAGNLRHRIPLTEPIHFNSQEVRISPYILGLLIGDGGLSDKYRTTFTSEDNKLIEAVDLGIAKFGCELKHSDKYDYFVKGSVKVLNNELETLGLHEKKSNEKFIPDIYKYNTVSNRTDILQGIMDTDGSISKIGVTEFVSTSKMLCDDVKFLVQSLGGVAYYSEKETHYTYKGEYKNGLLAHRLIINIGINPFRLERKASKWKPNPKYKPTRGIKEINYIGDRECVCIASNAEDHLYLTNECIITHNTIEALSLLRLHPKELLPAVIVCPSTVKLQWMFEIHRICGNGPDFLVQVIQSGKEKAMPGFKVYVVTYDMLKKDDMFSFLPENTIKTIIIDECHRIKNHLSDRAKAVQKIARNTPHILPMSGTPIKNNAGEYFTVLNLVKPTLFPHYQKYIDNYCDAYSSGWGQKVGGLKDVDRFHEDTKDIIIRRTKDQVLKDLPSKDRKFHHVELDRKLNKAYAAALQELEDMMYSDEEGFAKETNKIAIMGKLRHITGISKVEECVDFVTEFLLSTDRKIVVFTHHQDVMDMLEIKLNSWLVDGGFGKALCLRSALNGNERADLVTKFREDVSNRVMLSIFTEGVNLQFCSDAVILERQWNPANEENYAEDRFHRFGQLNNVSITYMIASGTIDDFFTELVEIKRSIVAATMDNKAIEWNQQSLMKELAETLVTRGRKAWSL